MAIRSNPQKYGIHDIHTGPPTKEYSEGHERVFGKRPEAWEKCCWQGSGVKFNCICEGETKYYRDKNHCGKCGGLLPTLK